jgi:hypothetical protein
MVILVLALALAGFSVADALVLSLDGAGWKLTNGSFTVENATVPGKQRDEY